MSRLGTPSASALDGIAHGGLEGFADLNLVKVSVLHGSSQFSIKTDVSVCTHSISQVGQPERDHPMVFLLTATSAGKSFPARLL